MNKHLQYCIDKATEIPHKRTFSRHYAIITDKRGKVISEARNSYDKTHPLMKHVSGMLGLHKEYCHAEMLALVRSKGKGHNLYVARVDWKGRPVPSAPCLVCQELINNSHIKEVIHT